MKQIAVIGSSSPTEEEKKLAYQAGKIVAECKAVLICGGMSGVMEEASRGAKENNGITVGILPGELFQCNRFIDIKIATGLSHIRNSLVVKSANGIVAIGGQWGTFSEVCFARLFNRPVVWIKPRYELSGIFSEIPQIPIYKLKEWILNLEV